MEDEEDNTTNGKRLSEQDDETASCTGEERVAGDAETFNARMKEAGASADDEECLDDTSFDEQLDHLDWESGEDPFDAREWQILRNNLEP